MKVKNLFHRWITNRYEWYSHSVFQKILYLLVLSLPSLLIELFKIEAIHSFFILILPHLTNNLQGNVPFNLFISFWVPIVSAIGLYFRGVANADAYYIYKNGLMYINTAAEEIEAQKCDRLGDAIKKQEYNMIEEMLISKEQFWVIIIELYNCLSKLNSTKNELAIRLWNVENSKIKEIITHYPKNGPNNIEKVISEQELTECKKAILSKTFIVVENSKKNKSFKRLDNCLNCPGCNILSIPITDEKNRNVFSVLQIRYKFTNNDRPVYYNNNQIVITRIFEPFVNRLLYEHRLRYFFSKGSEYIEEKNLRRRHSPITINK